MQRIIAGGTGPLLSLAVASPVWAGFCGLSNDEPVVITIRRVNPPSSNPWKAAGPRGLFWNYDRPDEAMVYTLATLGRSAPANAFYQDIQAGQKKLPPRYCTFTKRHNAYVTHFNVYRMPAGHTPQWTDIGQQHELMDRYNISFDIAYELLAAPAPQPAAAATDPAGPKIDEEIEDLFWQSVECESKRQVHAYLEVYPTGRYVAEARACLAQQGHRVQPPPHRREPPPPPPIINHRAVTADRNGCWDAQAACIDTTGTWTEAEDFHINFTNHCRDRVCSQYCFEVCLDDSLDGLCAAKGLDRGETISLVAPADLRPTGRTWVQWVGSREFVHDEDCVAHSSTWVPTPPFWNQVGESPIPCQESP